MGSHGGATGPGQLKVLASLGITDETLGCEIRSSMETRIVARIAVDHTDLPIHLDAHAAAADGVIVVNRIKPHTHFRGPTESGLTKMLVIGAGKHEQALAMHAHGVTGLRDLVPVSAQALVDTGRVLAGVALIEDGEHRLSHVEVIPAGQIRTREPDLLRQARSLMPRLPVDDIDLLVVDRIGKDISGTGMDTNVVGRVRALDFAGFERPRIRVVYARGLTHATAGNAIGVGLADLVHQRLVEAIDPVSTAVNAMTGGSPQTAAVPITATSDAEALSHFDRYLRGARPTSEVRLIRCRDTLSLQRLLVSRAVAEVAPADSTCTPVDLRWTADQDFGSVRGYD
ncbi:DUF362 domain-containing protein [Nocardioides humi]|nr:DUF362 domain-containing protein [Nocardioides humi]